MFRRTFDTRYTFVYLYRILERVQTSMNRTGTYGEIGLVYQNKRRTDFVNRSSYSPRLILEHSKEISAVLRQPNQHLPKPPTLLDYWAY